MNYLSRTILQVIPRLDSGGAERSTLEIAGAVIQAGGRAIVATSGGRLAPDIEKAGGEIAILPVHAKNPLTIIQNAGRLAKLMRDQGVDLIHARSRAPAWSALLAARRTRIPFVTTYHGAHGASGRIKRWYNSSLTRSNRVIANSRFTADAIIAAGRIEPDRLRVIPRGVDLALFDPAKISPARVNHMTADWGLPVENSALKLLLPGRLTAWKGHEIAIEAIAQLNLRSGSGKSAGLALVFCGGAQGQHNYETKLRAIIGERGVRDMVHLVGDCADMPAAYAWADVVIAPSTRPEAFGRVAVEAGAMMKPVVAAAHGGALETIIDGETGFLVRPGEAGDLADAISRLARMTKEERSVVGENGRARATSLYSANAMCAATLGVYRELLSEGG